MSVNSPFFSIIVPVYNRAERIAGVLDSVLSQGFTDFELIVVDDCSNDIEQLEKVINQFSDNRIRLIKHESNKNGAAARNTGIKAAKGQYISFLDSDDYWPDYRLKLVFDKLQQLGNPENTVLYGQVEIRSSQGKSLKTEPSREKGQLPVADYLFLHSGRIQTSTIVCDRKLATHIAFDERFIRHQDYDFCLRCEAEGYDFHYVDQVLAFWTASDGVSVVKKGATFDFCSFWLKQMAPYFSDAAKNAYIVKTLVPIAIEQGQFSNGFALLTNSVGKVPFALTAGCLLQCSKNLIKYVMSKRS